MPVSILAPALFVLASFSLRSRCHVAERCGWEERAAITLKDLVEPAVMLREYSDVTSAMDCYQKCCDLEDEGCNVASFMSYGAEVICMNVRCEPFDNCIWATYPTSIAAIIARPTNNVTNTFSHATMSDANNDTNTGHINAGNSLNKATSQAITGNYDVNTQHNVKSGTNREETRVNTTARTTGTPLGDPDPVKPLTTPGPDVFGKPESRHPNNPFHPAYTPDSSPGNHPTRPVGVGGKVSMDPNFSGDNGNMGSGNITLYVGGSASRVHFAVSVLIGALTCAAFLVVMYVAARRFHLFQDRSKYNRLLENPEQYADHYSDSEFKD